MEVSMETSSPGTVSLIIGKLCSGKTTFAVSLAAEHSGILLSCDELMRALHPVDAGFDYESELEKVKHYLLRLAVRLASAGTEPVLDWGFWNREERNRISVFLDDAGIPYRWYCLMPSDQEWAERISRRNAGLAESTGDDYPADEGLLRKCLEKYQEPTEEEIRQRQIVVLTDSSSCSVPDGSDTIERRKQ